MSKGLKVPLTRGYYAIVDPEDWPRVMMFKWSLNDITPGKRYARRSSNYEKIRLHNWIMNPPSGMEVDHINGDTLDCRKSNLRIVTRKQQMMNHKKRGVHQISKNKWRARIMINYDRIHLGYFPNEELANQAYDEAAKKYYGEFVRHQ